VAQGEQWLCHGRKSDPRAESILCLVAGHGTLGWNHPTIIDRPWHEHSTIAVVDDESDESRSRSGSLLESAVIHAVGRLFASAAAIARKADCLAEILD